MIGIYKFTNKLDGESYIGQSVDIKRRYNQHKNRYDNNNHKTPMENTYFHSMLRYYGFHNFDFEILEECDKEILDKKEKYYISLFNTQYPNGYNKTEGGTSQIPLKISRLDLDEIINDLMDDKLSEIEIANKFGVDNHTISMINQGKSWFNQNIDYPIRKTHSNTPKNKRHCVCCGNIISRNTRGFLCVDCYKKEIHKISKIPNKEELYQLLLTNSFITVGKMFGVSDNAVRKWCDTYSIPRHSKYYRSVSI